MTLLQGYSVMIDGLLDVKTLQPCEAINQVGHDSNVADVN